MERAMGLEPTTTCLGSRSSTTELRPHLSPLAALPATLPSLMRRCPGLRRRLARECDTPSYCSIKSLVLRHHLSRAAPLFRAALRQHITTRQEWRPKACRAAPSLRPVTPSPRTTSQGTAAIDPAARLQAGPGRTASSNWPGDGWAGRARRALRKDKPGHGSGSSGGLPPGRRLSGGWVSCAEPAYLALTFSPNRVVMRKTSLRDALAARAKRNLRVLKFSTSGLSSLSKSWSPAALR